MRHGKKPGGGRNRHNQSGDGGNPQRRDQQSRGNARDGSRQRGPQPGSGKPGQGGQGRHQGGRQGGHQGGNEKGKGRSGPSNLPGLIESPIRMTGKGLPPVEEPRKLPPRRYGIVFFDTLAAAKNDIARLQDLARGYDQLNIVIRAEASMDDPELTAVGKVFAGAAWALIHDRRVAEGWYDEAH